MPGKSFVYHVTNIDGFDLDIRNILVSQNPIHVGDTILISNIMLLRQFHKKKCLSAKFLVNQVAHVMSKNGARIKHSVIYLSPKD